MQADPATTSAANIRETTESIVDLVKKWAGKHKISPGTSNGTLTVPFSSHTRENEDDGDIADTNAISGENDATATVNVRITVQVAE